MIKYNMAAWMKTKSEEARITLEKLEPASPADEKLPSEYEQVANIGEEKTTSRKMLHVQLAVLAVLICGIGWIALKIIAG